MAGINALYQRLKELDRSEFEKLCYQLISERFPAQTISRVEGRGGDKGVDLFQGVLSGRPTIWQCKHFADGVRDSQKKQIKKSFRTALQHFQPHTWTLCIPIDLDTNAHCWFQQMVHEHSSEVRILLMDASAIIRLLVYHRPILKAFFPEAILDVDGLKALLLKTGDYSDGELSVKLDETVDQYIQRLTDKDSRFRYQLTYLTGAASGTDGLPSESTLPGAVFSLQQGNKRLDVLPRDIEALRTNPPVFNLRLSGEGAKKLQHAVTTGTKTVLEQGELISVQTTFDFLIPEELRAQPLALVLEPRFPKGQASLRVSFVSDCERVIYDFVEFELTFRLKEFELSSTSIHIPFHLFATFGPGAEGSLFRIESTLAGKDIREAQKFLHALRIIRKGGAIELYDLKSGKTFGTIHPQIKESSTITEREEQLTDDLCEIATAFAQPLPLPKMAGKEDLENLGTLLEIVRLGEIHGDVSNFTAELVRDETPAAEVLEKLTGNLGVRLDHDNTTIELCGVRFETGPVSVFIEKLNLRDIEQVSEKYKSLAQGESMPVAFEAVGSVVQIYHRFRKAASPDGLI